MFYRNHDTVGFGQCRGFLSPLFVAPGGYAYFLLPGVSLISSHPLRAKHPTLRHPSRGAAIFLDSVPLSLPCSGQGPSNGHTAVHIAPFWRSNVKQDFSLSNTSLPTVPSQLIKRNSRFFLMLSGLPLLFYMVTEFFFSHGPLGNSSHYSLGPLPTISVILFHRLHNHPPP